MGICYGEKGNKAKAKENFNRAKQLGDDTVDELMQKYKWTCTNEVNNTLTSRISQQNELILYVKIKRNEDIS